MPSQHSVNLTIPPERWAQLPTEARATLLRCDLYRVLSWSFLYPDAGVRQSVAETLEHLSSRTGDLPSHPQTLAALDKFREFGDLPLDQLQIDFNSCFGHTISVECPPYETQYTPGIIFAQTQKMADIAGFYRAFGVRISSHAHERPDHIAAELEFMGTLAFREAIAVLDGNRQHLEQARHAERQFLGEHLGNWSVSFAERLARKARCGFYEVLALCLRHMILEELQRAQLSLDSITPLQPAPVHTDPEGSCFSCGKSGEPVLVNLPGT